MRNIKHSNNQYLLNTELTRNVYEKGLKHDRVALELEQDNRIDALIIYLKLCLHYNNAKNGSESMTQLLLFKSQEEWAQMLETSPYELNSAMGDLLKKNVFIEVR